MLFDPSKYNTKPVNEAKPADQPKSGLFNPKAAFEKLAAQKEEEARNALLAKDPTRLAKPSVMGPVPTWSFSALKRFEACPHAIFLARVEKIKEKDGPAAERGSMIHQQAEDFVQGKVDELPPLLKKVEKRAIELRDRFERKPFLMTIEENWAFTTSWTPTEWVGPETWARQKLDVFYKDSPASAVILDWKSGKKFGNELKHGEQGLHYAIGAFMKYPELDIIQTEFAYTDHGEYLKKIFNRERAMLHLPKIHERAIFMTTTTSFPPKPSKANCKYCSYRESGDCDYAVEDF